ncbi:MAG: cytochrome b/b6 domain-containing protein, partial [Elusimicrobia bacterium]|nr:cytochrome b/b6 domain-containing protein [Elusimicrobiota bacterium]
IGFFGLHSLLWLLRAALDRLLGRRNPTTPADDPAILRFSLIQRLSHGLLILCFLGLTLTGLPLLYCRTPWARGLVDLIGGLRAAGLAHRAFAATLIALVLVHLVGILCRILRHGPRNVLLGSQGLLPRLKDLADCLAMFRWFLTGREKPRFDRWAYWEKFDYLAALFGTFIVAASGLLLWFPEFFSRFLPGEAFNVAKLVHGGEALLAIGFIFTVHFFNAHLRPDKFPVNDVIFTGLLPESQLLHERPAHYSHLTSSGQLPSLRRHPPGRALRVFAVLVAVIAMAIGIATIVLIVQAALGGS